MLVGAFFAVDLLLVSAVLYVVVRVMRFKDKNFKTAVNVSRRSSVVSVGFFLLGAMLLLLLDPYGDDALKNLFFLFLIFLLAYFTRLAVLLYLMKKKYSERLGKTLGSFLLAVYLTVGSWIFILILASSMLYLLGYTLSLLP